MMETALSMPSSDTSTRALPTLRQFFAPGGILANSPLPYEVRKGQYEMAKAVERALGERRHLIVEAGTGTGKTLAYLLPALRTGQRVIVSTGTKALQDQLFFRDVPFLEGLLGELRVCYMKGRGNYLCRRKLYALRDQPVLSGLAEIDEYQQIAEWERTTETGDRAELSGLPESSALWHKLDARSEACLGSTCPDYRRCFITEMRRRTMESDLIIVNHHLFFADAAVRRWPLPRRMRGFCRKPQLSSSTRRTSSKRWRRSTSGARFQTCALRILRAMPMCCCAARKARRRFTCSRSNCASGRGSFLLRCLTRAMAGIPSAIVKSFSNPPATFMRRSALRSSCSKRSSNGSVKRTKLRGSKSRAATLRADLQYMLEAKAANMVFWLERRGAPANPDRKSAPRGGARTTFLQATPIDVSEILRDLVWDQIPTAVLTSATLTVQGGFEHLRKRLGLGDRSQGRASS